MIQTEADFAEAFEDYLQIRNWRWMHIRTSIDPRAKNQYRTAYQGDPGWPDYAIVRHGRFLLIELKSEAGHLSPQQRFWRDALVEAGIDYHLFRPSDWPAIERILA